MITSLTTHKNSSGTLMSLNDFRDVPFVVKRLFYISDVPNQATRGFHAHRKNQQYLICLDGRIVVELKWGDSDGATDATINMMSGDAIFVDKMTWATQTYYDNAKLLVLCSREYNESDYIRNWEEYKNEY